MLVEAVDVYAVRANPRRLVMATGHETDRERIVLDYNRDIIVELAEQAEAAGNARGS